MFLEYKNLTFLKNCKFSIYHYIFRLLAVPKQLSLHLNQENPVKSAYVLPAQISQYQIER